MKNRLFLCLTLPVAALLVGCEDGEMKFYNGKIPAEMVAEAKKLEGVYVGKVGEQAVKLTFAINADNRAALTSDVDLIKEGCGSQIGNLLEATYDINDGKVELDDVKFFFTAAACTGAVMGNELKLAFDEQNAEFSLRIAKRQRVERQCRWEVHPGFPPREVCDYIPVTDYLRGEFKRQ